MSDDVEEKKILRDALAVVELGLDVQQFLGTKIGKYMVQRAEAERESALTQLIVADPLNPNKIIELQFQARIADAIQSWLADAYQAGKAQAQQLEDQQHSD